jgi:hypothetical protein
LGVKNLALTSFDNPDTKFRVEAFTHNDLKSGINIIDSANVPKVAASGDKANSTFGLAVGNGTIGWKNNGLTNLYTGTPSFGGTTQYETESTVSTPTLSFYFYHSKNIELAEDEDERQLGDVRLILTAIAPQIDDEVTSDVSTIEVVIHLVLTRYDEDGYANGQLIMFLKIQFLEGAKRKELFEKYPPKYIYVFRNRMATWNNGEPLDPNGKRWATTMCHAWFVWEKGSTTEPIVRWLD